MFSRQVPETTASLASALQQPNQFDDSRIESWRFLEHLHRQNLLAEYPLFDLVRDNSALGEELGEEFAVVDLCRSGRHFIGHLPSQRRERSLPGGDVVVVGLRDHPVEIEKNGFRRHEWFWDPRFS